MHDQYSVFVYDPRRNKIEKFEGSYDKKTKIVEYTSSDGRTKTSRLAGKGIGVVYNRVLVTTDPSFENATAVFKAHYEKLLSKYERSARCAKKYISDLGKRLN